ncbi:aminotransferase class IV [Tichowtungia aerotolerans]|uniref:Aminodeoxychorismate lyase n=1 Tax=Tichowtungia aerotolerans TaxID=2697043 RepID=A0A6P1M0Y1_9BACT|nr:aminotransferase class IV [Tichowtungia aerotolerans]QHI68449.1 aminodeoxychorismate lyase [Tichowtungia aerotolerans]
MRKFQTLENDEWLARLTAARSGLSDLLYAMYSSLTGGITTDPALMTIPADDHLAHRGDGVFESLKCINGSLYNVKAHLLRLERSCRGIDMELPCPHDELEQIICDTILAGNQNNCLVRVLVSRGTGNMGIDPAQCKGPELYVLAYRYTARIQDGKLKPARAAISSVPIKPPQLATIKTCNYLPNALMKLEANRRGVDFVISIDQNGNLGEGATENIGILTPDNELLMPPPVNILTGTTARRALDLAQQLVASGVLKCAEYRDISPNQAAQAREIFIFGTTTDVTSVIEWEGRPVNNGTPGPVAGKLLNLLTNDMTPQSDTLTEIFK